ncbi:MAG: Polysaccharide biosynthesis protein [Pseudomonadota bacterium]
MSTASFWRRSLARAVVMVLQSAASRVLGILSSGLLARMLTPLDWGALQAVTNVAGTLTQTLKLSVDGGLQIRISETKRAATEPSDGEFLAAGLVLLTIAVAAALLVGNVFGRSAASLFGDPSLAPWMGLGGAMAAGQLIGQIGVTLLSFGAFRTYGAINTWLAVAYVVVLGVGYVSGARQLGFAVAALLCMQVGNGVLMLVCSVRAWRARGIRLRFERVGRTSWDLLKLGVPVYLAAAVPAVVWFLVSARVARVTGLEALATVRIVATLNQIVSFVPAALAQTFLTQFAGARGAGNRVPTHDFVRYVRIIVAGSLLSSLGTMLIAPWLVPILFGPQYASAAKLVALGLMTATVLATKQAVLVGLMSERRTSYALLDALVASVAGALFALWWMPRLGIAGMMLAEFAAHALSMLVLATLLTTRLSSAAGVGHARAQAGVAALGLTLGLVSLATTYQVFDTPARLPWLLAQALLALVGVPWCLFTRDERKAAREELQRALPSRRSV